MIFVLKGKRYRIKSLTPELDEAFIQLHVAYMADGVANWSHFEDIAIRFFESKHEDGDATEHFFNNFQHIWNHFLSQGKYDEAELVWQQALVPALRWEQANLDRRIHKGGPYYFWGATAILRGDLDKGYALMHQALQEDSLTHHTKHPRTPAYFFATADHTELEQAFRMWPLRQAEFLAQRLDSYRRGNGKALTLEDLRSKFFGAPPSTDAIYLLAFTIARLIRVEELPPYVLKSDFVAQLQMNLLFDLALVVDASLKAPNPAAWKFVDHAAHLATKARLQLPKARLLSLNGAFTRDFAGTLVALLDGTYTFADGSRPLGLAVDLAITYGIRNRAAHDVRSVPGMWERYPAIERMLFNVLFLTVETLY